MVVVEKAVDAFVVAQRIESLVQDVYKRQHADRSRNLYNMVIKGMKNTRTPRQQTMEIPEDKIKEASIIDIPVSYTHLREQQRYP